MVIPRYSHAVYVFLHSGWLSQHAEKLRRANLKSDQTLFRVERGNFHSPIVSALGSKTRNSCLIVFLLACNANMAITDIRATQLHRVTVCFVRLLFSFHLKWEPFGPMSRFSVTPPPPPPTLITPCCSETNGHILEYILLAFSSALNYDLLFIKTKTLLSGIVDLWTKIKFVRAFCQPHSCYLVTAQSQGILSVM